MSELINAVKKYWLEIVGFLFLLMIFSHVGKAIHLYDDLLYMVVCGMSMMYTAYKATNGFDIKGKEHPYTWVFVAVMMGLMSGPSSLAE